MIPRRSLSRSVVRFEKLNASSLTDSSELTKNIDFAEISRMSKSSEMNKSGSQSSETFYSPNTSGNDKQDNKASANTLTTDVTLDTNIKSDMEVDMEISADAIVKNVEVKHISPKGRSSYRDLSADFRNIDVKLTESNKLTKKGIILKEIGKLYSSRFFFNVIVVCHKHEYHIIVLLLYINSQGIKQSLPFSQ